MCLSQGTEGVFIRGYKWCVYPSTTYPILLYNLHHPFLQPTPLQPTPSLYNLPHPFLQPTPSFSKTYPIPHHNLPLSTAYHTTFHSLTHPLLQLNPLQPTPLYNLPNPSKT